MSQVEIFGRIAGVTGLVMTKLDGTARGGILVAIADKFALPVHFIGVGEGVDDLEPFTARDFAEAIAGVERAEAAAMTGPNVTETPAAPPPRKALNPTVKFVLELGPLALFFAANSRPQLFHGLVGGLLPSDFPPDKAGMLTATAVLIPATFIALVISFALTRRLPLMPVITTGMVLVFGALTLWLQDKTFIEIKLTIIYCMFGAALLGRWRSASCCCRLSWTRRSISTLPAGGR